MKVKSHPYGEIEITIAAIIVGDQPRVSAEVKDAIFLPIVSLNTIEAREFARLIVNAADRAESAIAGLTKPKEGQA
jgi:hypothetical protein